MWKTLLFIYRCFGVLQMSNEEKPTQHCKTEWSFNGKISTIEISADDEATSSDLMEQCKATLRGLGYNIGEDDE